MNISSDRLSLTGCLTNGLISGTFTAACIHPIRTTYVCLMNNQGVPPLRHQYKGFTASLIGIIPNQTISFLTRGCLLRYSDPEKHGLTSQFLMGLFPAAAYAPSATMSERVMTVGQVHKLSFVKSCRTIYQVNGVNGYLKGFSAVWIKETCFTVGAFPCSDMLIAHFQQEDNIVTSSFLRLFVGASVGLITTPLEVVRVRMQQDLTKQYPTIMDTGRHILKEEGIRALWKGTYPRMTFVSLATVLLASTKQYVPSCVGLS